jgi:hypothetical protein
VTEPNKRLLRTGYRPPRSRDVRSTAVQRAHYAMLTRVITPLAHPAHTSGAARIDVTRAAPRATAPTRHAYPAEPPRLRPTTP